MEHMFRLADRRDMTEQNRTEHKFIDEYNVHGHHKHNDTLYKI